MVELTDNSVSVKSYTNEVCIRQLTEGLVQKGSIYNHKIINRTMHIEPFMFLNIHSFKGFSNDFLKEKTEAECDKNCTLYCVTVSLQGRREDFGIGLVCTSVGLSVAILQKGISSHFTSASGNVQERCPSFQIFHVVCYNRHIRHFIRPDFPIF